MFLLAVVGQSFLTFMPVLYIREGLSVVSAGTIYAIIIEACTVSGLSTPLVGKLADMYAICRFLPA
jgi:FSR family fosmidomycin resistance protein-like MFS transporter